MNPVRVLGISLLILLIAAVMVGISLRPLIGQGGSSGRPFQQRFEFTSTPTPSVTVPTGKRWKMTNLTAKITVASGLQPMLSIKTSVGSAVASHQMFLQRQVANVAGTDVYVASEALGDIFADGGTEVTAVAELTSVGSFTGTVTVSGLLIDE